MLFVVLPGWRLPESAGLMETLPMPSRRNRNTGRTVVCRLALFCGIAASLLNHSSAAAAGKYNPELEIGSAAPVWADLPGTDDKKHSLEQLKGKKAVIVVFTCCSCPYSVDYEARLVSLAGRWLKKDSPVALVAINVNKVEEDRLPAMKKRAEEQGFRFPWLYDETQDIARKFGATWTPECFVLDAERRVVYMGALDDNPDATKAKVNYVDRAVEAVLAGTAVEVTETPAIGCRIRYERKRRRRPKTDN